MPDPADDKTPAEPEKNALVPPHDDEPMGDEEKIMTGRHDVNYPAHLTQDVPGG